MLSQGIEHFENHHVARTVLTAERKKCGGRAFHCICNAKVTVLQLKKQNNSFRKLQNNGYALYLKNSPMVKQVQFLLFRMKVICKILIYGT